MKKQSAKRDSGNPRFSELGQCSVYPCACRGYTNSEFQMTRIIGHKLHKQALLCLVRPILLMSAQIGGPQKIPREARRVKTVLLHWMDRVWQIQEVLKYPECRREIKSYYDELTPGRSHASDEVPDQLLDPSDWELEGMFDEALRDNQFDLLW